MFPVFPQLQVALPSIQRVPLAITNTNANEDKVDIAKWLQESFLQFAAPKKRVLVLDLFNNRHLSQKEE